MGVVLTAWGPEGDEASGRPGGPVFLGGSAKSTAGKWRAAPLPQWDASKPVSGNWGGSTTAVMTGTPNASAAAKFAEFLNTDPETTKMFNTEQNFFPATKALLADPEFASQKSAFFVAGR